MCVFGHETAPDPKILNYTVTEEDQVHLYIFTMTVILRLPFNAVTEKRGQKSCASLDFI